MKETWKPIPDFPEYEVSDQGRIRSYYKLGQKKNVVVDKPQRILKTAKRDYGRVYVTLCRNGKLHSHAVAYLVLLAFVGPRPEGMEVCHNDGDPANNHLGNLRYDTHANNMRDRTDNPNFRRLRHTTEEEVLAIRNKRAAGASLTELAEEYDLTFPAISKICTGKSRASVGGPLTFGIMVPPGRKRCERQAAMQTDWRQAQESVAAS